MPRLPHARIRPALPAQPASYTASYAARPHLLGPAHADEQVAAQGAQPGLEVPHAFQQEARPELPRLWAAPGAGLEVARVKAEQRQHLQQQQGQQRAAAGMRSSQEGGVAAGVAWYGPRPGVGDSGCIAHRTSATWPASTRRAASCTMALSCRRRSVPRNQMTARLPLPPPAAPAPPLCILACTATATSAPGEVRQRTGGLLDAAVRQADNSVKARPSIQSTPLPAGQMVDV